MTIINPVVVGGGGGGGELPFWWAEEGGAPGAPQGFGVHYHLQGLPGMTTLNPGGPWTSPSSAYKLTIHGSDLTTIGSGALNGWGSAAELIIEPGVTTIADSGAPGWTSATKLVLPETVTSLGSFAFGNGWVSLTDLTLPTHLTSVGANAFQNTALTSVTLSADVVGDSVFEGCASLTHCTIEATDTIGSNVLNGCANIEEVTMVAGQSIGDNVAGQAPNGAIQVIQLTAPTIGDHIAGNGGMSAVKKIVFGEGTEDIGFNVTHGSTEKELQVLDFPSTLESIGSCDLWSVNTVHVIYRGAPVSGQGDKFGASFSFPTPGSPTANEVRLYVPDEHLSAFLSDPDLGGWSSFGSTNIYALSTFVDPTE